MTAFRSSVAVMAARHEPADSLDFFPTPPWATRAAVAHVLPQLDLVGPAPARFGRVAWDPCCGAGHMALALGDDFATVHASDIHDYGFGARADFLHPDLVAPACDWIFINPPFNRAAEFIATALKIARVGVAVLARLAFLEGEGRHRTLFARRPPQLVAQFVERVAMHKGRWVINGKTATAYAWLVWMRVPSHQDYRTGTRFVWIPPCRRTLTRHDDWLTYGGCVDLPKTHPAMAMMERMAA